MMKAISLAVLLIAAIAKVVVGDPPAPSGDKKENIASPADSPRQALCKLVTAINVGDAAAVRTYMAIDPSNDPAYADNWAAILTCQGRLKKVIREKLGAESLRRWENDIAEEEKRFSLNVSLKEIEAAEVSRIRGGAVEVGPLDKTRAVLNYPSNFIRLCKDDRIWKVDIQDWTALPRGDKRKRLSLDTLGGVDQMFGDALNAIADQLEQGKIKTDEEFSHAIRKAMGTEPSESSNTPPQAEGRSPK